MALDILTIDIGRTINHSKTSNRSMRFRRESIETRSNLGILYWIESEIRLMTRGENAIPSGFVRGKIDDEWSRSNSDTRWRCLKSFGRDSPWRLFSLALWIATISVVNFDFRSEGELSFLFHRNLREKMNDRYLSVHRSNEQTFPFLGVDPWSLSRWRPLRRRILKVD